MKQTALKLAYFVVRRDMQRQQRQQFTPTHDANSSSLRIHHQSPLRQLINRFIRRSRYQWLYVHVTISQLTRIHPSIHPSMIHPAVPSTIYIQARIHTHNTKSIHPKPKKKKVGSTNPIGQHLKVTRIEPKKSSSKQQTGKHLVIEKENLA